MRLRVLILACAATAGGCGFLYVQRIWYDLTASVVGLVDRSDLRNIAGDRYDEATDWFWTTYANDQRQLLHVRLSTRKDLVSFANRKGTNFNIKWRFCDMMQQAMRLGPNTAFVDAARVSAISHERSPVVADSQGRFAYDAILYVRDTSPPATHRRQWGKTDAEIEKPYDLERDPRDVCVWVLMGRKLSGFKTNVVRIPKEEIAAALGVAVGADQQRQ